MCLLRIDLPNLCPNMIHIHALDFSECHSEEVSFDAQCSCYTTSCQNNSVKGDKCHIVFRMSECKYMKR